MLGDRRDPADQQNGEHPPASNGGSDRPDPHSNGAFLPPALINRAIPLYYADRDARFVYRNQPFDEIAQAAYPEFRSRERREQAKALVPNELRQIFDRLNAGEREIKQRQSFEIDGELRHFRSVHFRVFDGEEPTGYGGLYTDVTLEAEAVMQSARTETRFQDVIRSASDWVWETDENLNLTYVSNRIAEALEAPPSVVVGRHLFTLGEFEDSPARPDLAASLMPFRGRVFLMPDKRGRTRRISMTGVAVFDDRTGAFNRFFQYAEYIRTRHGRSVFLIQPNQLLTATLHACLGNCRPIRRYFSPRAPAS